MQDTHIILEEGNLPHPQFPRCDMLVPWATFNYRHPNTAQCTEGAEQKRCRLTAEDMRESTEWDYQTYGRPLTWVSLLKYLGQFLTASEDYWPELVGKIRKVRMKWDRLLRILGREGANTRVPRAFFNVVVQAVLLLGRRRG